MKVLICAGGTGGGIYPALAAATELCSLGLQKQQLFWVGTRGEMEEELVPQANLALETISAGPIAGVSPWVKMVNGSKSLWGLVKAIKLMRRIQPDVVFITGGYVAVPVTLAAWISRVPICIYLPDVEPGAAIKLSMRFARKVASTTDDSLAYVPARKLVVTGYPVRKELRRAAKMSRGEALARFGLRAGRQTLFVFGGSRGARSINQALISVLPELLETFQIIHVSGTFTWTEVAANAENIAADLKAYYRPYPYLHEEMGAAFRCADLVVARAGASMLGECPAFGVPAVLVPYPYAWRYQKVNADYMSERGAAVQLKDERLADDLLSTVTSLLKDGNRLARMGDGARALDRPDAAADLAKLIMTVGKSRASTGERERIGA